MMPESAKIHQQFSIQAMMPESAYSLQSMMLESALIHQLSSALSGSPIGMTTSIFSFVRFLDRNDNRYI
jgi:hypothetical protein